MRARMTMACAVAGLAAAVPSWADGRCDLNGLVGYQVMFGKPIAAYIQNGKKISGYIGCEPDRVLVFADGTGVRCKEINLQKIEGLPAGYLFGKSLNDLKLCVEGQVFEVSPTN